MRARLGNGLVALLAAVGLVTVFVAVDFALEGASARKEPSAVERRVARTARHLLIPSRSRERVNPMTATEENLTAARRHFADHCAVCHGNDGAGDTPLGRRMSPRAPDLRAAATQRLADGELFWIIENGVRLTGMPGFGDSGPADDDESWELVLFIRHLPEISAGELAEMERWNPTLSPADVESERAIEAFLAGAEPTDDRDHR